MKNPLLTLSVLLLHFAIQAADAPVTKVTVDLNAAGTPISPDLFGVFFEDLNYAADGGLYAELIQNRSFEYQATEQPTWNSLSFWELAKRGGGQGAWAVEAAQPIHPNNPHYVLLRVQNAGDGVGLINPGFDGIPVKAGEIYDVSFFARQLWMNRRDGIEGKPMPMTARLESKEGEVLGEVSLEISGRDWARIAAAIAAVRSDAAARFVLLARAAGGIALDEISLFPRNTFRDRPNGMRADLAQTIADLHPKFVRFPGGCLVHGDGINNFYRWKDTIGPIEQRKGQANIWRYHQSVGLGYFEYFQFCEDIGAKPLPILPAAVSCQNSDWTPGTGQQLVPKEDMPAYVQDVLDLIEWANGPTNSTWGSRRAAAGHSAPFHLEYLGIGNEDKITPGFKERFTMIFEAIRAKHPEITVIGTVGPAPRGVDFDEGWKLAGELKVPIVDEHYYAAPQWFWDNLERYDTYDRTKSKVYVGEYAAHDAGKRSTLRAAIAEAAYLTSLERNGDIVQFASFAPLLARIGNTQWNPDLIYFNNTEVFPTISYHVQKLFGNNAGDTCLQTTLDGQEERFTASTVQDSKTGDTILKLVNGDANRRTVQVELKGQTGTLPKAVKTVLSGSDPDKVNRGRDDAAGEILPVVEKLRVNSPFELTVEPHSLTIMRIPRK